MNRQSLGQLCVGVFCGALLGGCSHVPVDEGVYLKKSRALFMKKVTGLKLAMHDNMKTMGPLKLLEEMEAAGNMEACRICDLDAQEVVDSSPQDDGAVLKMTSLKYRNTDNQPDDWETSALTAFNQRQANGEGIKSMEFYQVVEGKDSQVFRYIKPMPVKKVCLTCHGEAVMSPIGNKIAKLYPNDKAMGFKLGDIRGALSIQYAVK